MIGINISGAEFGSGWGGQNDREYHWPTLSELQFYKDKGVDLVRLPFTWERMQPNAWGALNPSELALLKRVLTDAATLGMDIIIDLHNYGRYYGQRLNADGGPTSAQFADFWTKLASEIKGFSSLVGYDLMNEPNNMTHPDAWKNAAQAAVNAIRVIDKDNIIFVEGNDWSGAWSWKDVNSNFIINDPANKLVYQAHQYFDRDSSGVYSGTYDTQGAHPMVGVDKLKPFVEWLNQHGFKGMIGETGVPSNDPRWLEVMKNAMDYMKANNLIVTAWGGGTWWPSDYSMYMGAPGRPDSKYLDFMEGYFTPWVEGTTTTTAPAPAPAPAPTPVVTAPPPPTSGTTEGADVVRGTALYDVIDAKGGNDTIFGSAVGDLINGGTGIDVIDYSAATGRVDVDLTRAEQIGSDAAGDRLSNIENVTGSAFNDALSGDWMANVLVGGSGDDVLQGRGGADRLDGGAGFDIATYDGSAAGVVIDLMAAAQQNGDAAGDVLIGIEAITGSAWDDILRGSNNGDTLRGGRGNDLLEGRGGADVLIGGEGSDTVTYAGSDSGVQINMYHRNQHGGHASGDTLSEVENITGSRFSDHFTGDGGNNRIDGGAGDDWINGSWGADTLTGGAGRDFFLFDSVGNANGDRVTDFNTAEDRLDFSHIDANSQVSGNQGFTWIGSGAFTRSAGQMRTFVENGTTHVAGDVNGDGIPDFTVALTGSIGLNSGHIFL
jgi:aryl-phospho-beta-D-glucosidase BglC (GH1 family)